MERRVLYLCLMLQSFDHHSQALYLQEAVEPSSIIYENTHVRYSRRVLSWILCFIVSGCLMVASFFVIQVLLPSLFLVTLTLTRLSRNLVMLLSLSSSRLSILLFLEHSNISHKCQFDPSPLCSRFRLIVWSGSRSISMSVTSNCQCC
jgi:hypothetical protein